LTKEVHRTLSMQFQERQTEKRYVALLEGLINQEKGSIELPFRLDVDNRPHQIYDPEHGKMGLTHWQKIGDEKGYSRVSMTPVTGRTHQLRLHAAHEKGLGVPIVGDPLYGSASEHGQMKLHACYLSFIHPISGAKISFESEVPF
jgi:tRNA pseudouridine32 synthase / 23S rRNA pseudouridine746 synthase